MIMIIMIIILIIIIIIIIIIMIIIIIITMLRPIPNAEFVNKATRQSKLAQKEYKKKHDYVARANSFGLVRKILV